MEHSAVAILGGTGEQGLGLAYRFAKAGLAVRIGSRKLERAEQAVQDVQGKVPDGDVAGFDNPGAVHAAQGGVVILSVPFEHTVSTLKSVQEALTPGTVLVSMGVPLATSIGDVAPRVLGVSQGSVAELVASLAPPEVEVVSAFQNVAAHRLMDLDQEVDCDVIVSGPLAPRKRIMALAETIPGVRGVNGGPLYNARYVEQLTALMIGLNIRHKLREGTGIRITYL